MNWTFWILTAGSAGLLLLTLRERTGRFNINRLLLWLAAWQVLIQIGALAWFGRTVYLRFGEGILPPTSQLLLTEGQSYLQPFVAGAIHAALWFAILWYFFLRRGKGAMLDVRDVQLLVLGLVATGWPAGLIFLAGVFALSVIGMITLVTLRKKKVTDRLIVTPYIIPAAIMTLIFKAWLLDWTGLIKIRF